MDLRSGLVIEIDSVREMGTIRDVNEQHIYFSLVNLKCYPLVGSRVAFEIVLGAEGLMADLSRSQFFGNERNLSTHFDR